MDRPTDTLVLLHGLYCTPDIWAPASSVLSARLPLGTRVIAPFLPALDSVEALADTLLAELPERFALAGFSFGGYVALAMLQRAPERIERFALVCSTARADTEAARAVRARAIDEVLAGDFAGVFTRFSANAIDPRRAQDTALLAEARRIAFDYGADRLVAHQRACMARPDRTAVLARYDGPRMLLAADRDALFSPEAMRALAPDAALVVVPDSGHMLPIERPEPMAHALADWYGAAR